LVAAPEAGFKAWPLVTTEDSTTAAGTSGGVPDDSSDLMIG
jgi:hypothetical protein